MDETEDIGNEEVTGKKGVPVSGEELFPRERWVDVTCFAEVSDDTPNENGRYSEKDAEHFANSVNATMVFNYSNQSELGPYEGTVPVLKMTTGEALLYLNRDKSSQELLNR